MDFAWRQNPFGVSLHEQDNITQIVWIMLMWSCVRARGCEWVCVDRKRRGARQGSVTITCVESSVAAVRMNDGGQPLFTRL